MSLLKPTVFSKTLITTLLLGFATTATAAATYPVSSNANDDFVTKPTSGLEINTGATFKVDEQGFPTADSLQTLYDEMDYQGAVSAYLQSLPQMNLFGSAKTNHYYGAKGNTDSLVMYKDPSIDGMLTPNRVVTYLFNYPNLAETGPLVYEYPAGATAGIILDMQMRWQADVGLTSPRPGKAQKYLLLTVDQEVPAELNKDEYEIIQVRTNQLFLGFRVLDPSKDFGLEKELKIYPYAERANPQPNKFFQAKKTDDTYYMAQPTGMKYWEQLHQYIQIERVDEADRYMLARLKAVGIEKGKPFNPTERQIRILEKAALVGEKMAINVSFNARTQAALYREDTNWVHPLTLDPSHEMGPIYQLEERVDWTYEAYGISKLMKSDVPGKGSTYLAAYRDKNGDWFDGGKTYKFHIAPDAPAARFWDVSAYTLEKRGLLPDAPGKVSAINTFTKNLKKNADGSIDIFFGPDKAPEGYENNFINTYKGVKWFSYFRLYGPTQTYFDRSWKMYDIEEVK